MSKITYESLRKNLDKILDLARPILEQKKLIEKLSETDLSDRRIDKYDKFLRQR